MPKQRGADLLVNSLASAGVQRLFTLSGNQILSVFDACLDSSLELIHVRHEAAAVHMADAWGRLTGQPGVALLTAGPGHANGLSALYVARQAESPLVMLSGHCPRSQLGRGGFQEMPQAEMASHVAKASWTASEPARLGEDIAKAFRLAAAGRPGPVHVSLPADVLEADVAGKPAPLLDEDFQPPTMPLLRAEAVAMLELLSQAARPLIVAGPALCRAAASEALDRLQQATQIPVVATESPRGINDPSLGALSEVLQQADFILLLGKKLDCTLRFGATEVFAPSCRFAQVDAESQQLERSLANLADPSQLVAVATADPILAAEQLAEAAAGAEWNNASWQEEVAALIDYRPAEWNDLSSGKGPLHPARLCRAVASRMSEEDVLVSDGGEFGQWAQAVIRTPRRVINGPSGSIGGGLSFALAAQLAFPSSRVVCTLGDGTFGFHALELDTAVRHNLNVIVVIGNDARWNAETQLQAKLFGPDRVFACDLLPTRYDQLAKSLGAAGENVASESDLAEALDRAWSATGPVCINAAIQPEAAPVIRRG